MDNFLKTIYTLNDETRVKILLFIKKYKEVCVCDVENSFNMTQSRVSRHLKILKTGGFLNIDRRGKWAFYSIKKELTMFREAALKEIDSIDINIPEIVATCEVHQK